MDETDVSLHSGPKGEPAERGPSTGNFENSLNEGTGYGGTICMGGLLGETGGGSPLLRALKVVKGRLWTRVSLFMGSQLNNLEWARLPGTLVDG